MIPSRSSLAAAALLFGIVQLPAQGDLRADIDQALDKARPVLLAHLKAADDATTRPGELALLLLAAIHDGVDPAAPEMLKPLKRLVASDPGQTYDLALRLLVLEAVPGIPERLEIARKDTQDLLRHRAPSGGFGYGPKASSWDLSNTQYAVLGLRAAQAIGVEIDRAVWAKAASCIGAEQEAYGGFSYSTRGRGLWGDGYASMTAAGIAVLAICKHNLGADRSQDLDLKLERAWQWFDRNKAAIGSPTERWSFYCHYGLERAAILCDKTKVGDVDWYEKGARMLVDRQLGGGGWTSETDGYTGTTLNRGRGHGVPTAFAVLFLRRKFQKVSGPITPHIVTLAAVGPMSKIGDIEACTAELVRRGKPALPDVLKALRSEIEPQRRAAGKALLQLAGEDFGFDAARDQDGNRDALRKAELWYLKNR